jgi:hypothetical protein
MSATRSVDNTVHARERLCAAALKQVLAALRAAAEEAAIVSCYRLQVAINGGNGTQ